MAIASAQLAQGHMLAAVLKKRDIKM